MLTDPGTGKGIAIAPWETEEALEASEESGYYREQLGKLAKVLAGQPEREVREVGVRA